MLGEHPEGKVYGFGTFALNVREGVLTKRGVRIRLQGQPFRILTLLLERPGQLVTREEIQQLLWSSTTFVEFDDALNTAVRKLRNALGDSAENPRFIETVPRRGYRLLVPVTILAQQESQSSSPAAASAQPVAAAALPPAPAQMAAAQPKRRFLKSVSLLFVLLAAGIALAWGAYWKWRRAAFQVTTKDSIVLADFLNTTGDGVFDDTLKQALQVDLEQSPFFNIVSERKALTILKQMGRSPDQRLTGAVVIEVCQRSTSKVAVQGQISSLGRDYLIGLAAIRCDTGDAIADEQIEAKSKEEVVDALGRATSRLRARLGESVPSIQKFGAPLETATTPSLEALKTYNVALSTWDRKGDQASIPLFQKAIELDPQFAMAYGGLATIYHNLNETELARTNATRAYKLRDRVTESEKAAIDARYNLYVTGDLEAAARVYELWARDYPRAAGVFNHLGTTQAKLGDYEAAVESFRGALALDPSRVTTYSNLATNLMALNRLSEADAVLAEAQKRQFDTDFLLQVRYWRAFLAGDRDTMQKILLHSTEIAGAQSLLLATAANTEAYYGHFQKSREVARVAAELMRHEGDKETAAACLAESAMRDALIGASAQARQSIEQALKLSHAEETETLAAVIAARVGDIEQARKISDQLSRQYPSGTFVQKYWLPVIRAEIDLRNGQPRRAIDDLDLTPALERGTAPELSVATEYPVFLRGEAYLTSSDAVRAATEFQKLIDRPGEVMNFPTASLSRLGLAKSLARSSDPAKARQAFQEFFTIWKDADANLPPLKDARSAYATLSSSH